MNVKYGAPGHREEEDEEQRENDLDVREPAVNHSTAATDLRVIPGSNRNTCMIIIIII